LLLMMMMMTMRKCAEEERKGLVSTLFSHWSFRVLATP